MTGTPTLRPPTLRHRQPVATRLGALIAAAILLATCAETGPAPSDATPGSTPFASGAAAPTTGPTPGDGPVPTPEPEWTTVVPTLPDPVATLEPTRTAASGVPVDAAFRITSLTGEDAVAMARRLTTEPSVDLAVARADDGAALVTPTRPLARSTLYRFTLVGADGTVQGTWPMQTVRELRIVHTIPEEESDAVPVTTGIELTFNADGVVLSDVERYFSIDPAVPGHLEQSDRSVVFVPDAPLAPATRYRVGVREGLPLAGTDQVLEDALDLQFVTAGYTEPALRVGFRRNLIETGTADKAIFPIFVALPYDEDDEPIGKVPARIDVKLHRLPGMAEAIAGWRTLGSYWWDTSSTETTIDTASLSLVVDASVKLRDFGPTLEYEDDSRWFRLPRTLPAGWYVATIEAEGSASQAVLQVTDVAVYALSTTSSTLVWANDLATGRPIRGASASMGETALGTTDRKGLVEGATPSAEIVSEETPRSDIPVVVVRDGNRAAFTIAGDPECGKCGYSSGSPWWRVFQLDRARYRTTDTIAGWGVIRAREDRSVPAAVTVRLVAWDDWEESETLIAEMTAAPDANGAFLAKLPLTDAPPGEYSVEVAVGDDLVASASFSVGEILKPAWSVEVTPKRHAVVAGAKLDIDVEAAFYEGTPVGGTPIKVGQHKPYAQVTTDLEGDASATVDIKARRGESWGQPWWVTTVRAVPLDPEEAQVGGSADVAVFRASVIPEVEAVATTKRLTVAGRVHDVAFDRFENPPAEGIWAVDPYGAPREGARVDVRVRKHTWTTTKVGSTYDFISKQTVPVYRTRERVVDLGTRTLRSNGQGRFRLVLPVSGAADGYEVIVTAFDSRGRSVKVETWGDAPVTESAPDLRAHLEGPGSWDYPTELSVGEGARVAFTGGAGSTPDSRYLWTISQSGLRDAVVTTKPSVNLTFKKAWIPTGHVHAVRFTGHGYEVPDSSVPLVFDLDDRRLAVTMTADQHRYRPGDLATVRIRVRGPDGNPVRASVYVRAIDEKLFAMGAARVEDPLPTLYMDEGSGVTGIGWTHHDPRPIDGGGGGDATGGGGGREDFRDWLVNTIVTTDAQGRASVSFTVSDDLTSWRIVGEAISGDLSMGSGIVSIPVSIPFFAEATVAPSYLATDQPVIAARAFGGGMTADTDVRFTFSSETLGLAPTTVTAKAFRPAEIALPALASGKHSMRIEAVTGTGADAVTDVLVRTFEVVGPRAVVATTTSAPLTGRTPVAAANGFTTLVLSDIGRGRVIPILQELADEAGTRGDSALAAGVARRVLADTFAIDDGGAAPEISGFRGEGYSIVPWGSGEPQLTALALMSGDPRVRGMSWWFDETDLGSREGDLYALAGRAADGKPVLADIRAFQEVHDLTIAEQVALGLALVAAGDEAGARQVEQGIIRGHAQRFGPWVRIQGGGSPGDAVLTARTGIIAAWLGDPLAVDMDAFVVDNPPTDRLLNLERALAAAAWVDRAPAATASATLTVDGVSRTLDVTGGKAATIVLTPAQAAGAALEPGSGSVLVTTRVAEPIGRRDLEPVSGLAIARTFSPSGEIDATDRIRVTLRVTVPATAAGDCWMVTETVPSGLRPILRGSDDEEYDDDGEAGTSEPWSSEGQQMRWCARRGTNSRPEVTITYLARVLTAGTYTWEPAVVQSALAPDKGVVLPQTTVTIRGMAGG